MSSHHSDQCLKGHKSLGLLLYVNIKRCLKRCLSQAVSEWVSEWVNEWVSEWHAVLLSCLWTAKNKIIRTGSNIRRLRFCFGPLQCSLYGSLGVGIQYKTSQELRMLSTVTLYCQVKLLWIQGLNCQNCNQCLKCRKSAGLSSAPSVSAHCRTQFTMQR